MEHIDFKIEVSGCGVSDNFSGSVVSDSVISGTGDLGFSGNSEGVSGSVVNSCTGRYVLGSGDNESVPAVSGVLGNNVVLGSRDGVEADSDVSGRFCCYLCIETSFNGWDRQRRTGYNYLAKGVQGEPKVTRVVGNAVSGTNPGYYNTLHVHSQF